MEKNKQKSIEEQFDDAIISLQTYTDFLITYKAELKSAKAVIDFVVNNENQNERLTGMLKTFAFPVFARLQSYISKINKEKREYVKKFQPYIQNNIAAKELFCEKIKILQPLLEKYEKITNEQIKRCFEYIKASCEDENQLT